MANTTISIGGFYTPTISSTNTFTVLFGDIPSGTINFSGNGFSPINGGFNVPTVNSILVSNTSINQISNSESFSLSNSNLPTQGGFYVATVTSVTRMSTFIQTAPDPFGAPAAPSSQYWYMS